MENKPKSLHVNPVGENWEVESDAITMGQAETKSEAIEFGERAGVHGQGFKHLSPYFGRLGGDRYFRGSISQNLQHRTVVLRLVEESANPSPSALSSYAPLGPARGLSCKFGTIFDKIKALLLVNSEQSW